MPWTFAQNKLWRRAAHDVSVAKQLGLTRPRALRMANEGIIKTPGQRTVASALQARHQQPY